MLPYVYKLNDLLAMSFRSGKSQSLGKKAYYVEIMKDTLEYLDYCDIRSDKFRNSDYFAFLWRLQKEGKTVTPMNSQFERVGKLGFILSAV